MKGEGETGPLRRQGQEPARPAAQLLLAGGDGRAHIRFLMSRVRRGRDDRHRHRKGSPDPRKHPDQEVPPPLQHQPAGRQDLCLPAPRSPRGVSRPAGGAQGASATAPSTSAPSPPRLGGARDPQGDLPDLSPAPLSPGNLPPARPALPLLPDRPVQRPLSRLDRPPRSTELLVKGVIALLSGREREVENLLREKMAGRRGADALRGGGPVARPAPGDRADRGAAEGGRGGRGRPGRGRTSPRGRRGGGGGSVHPRGKARSAGAATLWSGAWTRRSCSPPSSSSSTAARSSSPTRCCSPSSPRIGRPSPSGSPSAGGEGSRSLAPRRGWRKDLVEMAGRNAAESFRERGSRREAREAVLEEVRERLHLGEPAPADRMLRHLQRPGAASASAAWR